MLTVRELLWESLTVLEPEVLRVVLLSLIISIASGLANLYLSVGMSILVSSLTSAAWSALFISLLLPAALGAPRPPIGSWLVAGVRLWLPVLATELLFQLGLVAGLLAFVVPGFLLLAMWVVAVPALVNEGLSPIASLKRSAELTRGHRGTLLLAMLPLSLLEGATMAPVFGGLDPNAVGPAQYLVASAALRLFALPASAFPVVAYASLLEGREKVASVASTPAAFHEGESVKPSSG